jgi:hypothetical protein
VSQYIGENHRVARKLETYLQLSQNVSDALTIRNIIGELKQP